MGQLIATFPTSVPKACSGPKTLCYCMETSPNSTVNKLSVFGHVWRYMHDGCKSRVFRGRPEMSSPFLDPPTPVPFQLFEMPPTLPRLFFILPEKWSKMAKRRCNFWAQLSENHLPPTPACPQLLLDSPTCWRYAVYNKYPEKIYLKFTSCCHGTFPKICLLLAIRHR